VREGQAPLAAGPVAAGDVPRLLDGLVAGRLSEAGADYLGRQQRVLLERCGVTDPADIADAIRHGTYAAFARVLADGKPERVIEEVRAAGLTGRGGAYFQAAVKWAACRAATGTPKYLVVNGEEGEPGIFKDRHLMEGDPHRLLEAALLAAYAAGASRAIVYIHGEAELSAARVAAAAAQACPAAAAISNQRCASAKLLRTHTPSKWRRPTANAASASPCAARCTRSGSTRATGRRRRATAPSSTGCGAGHSDSLPPLAGAPPGTVSAGAGAEIIATVAAASSSARRVVTRGGACGSGRRCSSRYRAASPGRLRRG